MEKDFGLAAVGVAGFEGGEQADGFTGIEFEVHAAERNDIEFTGMINFPKCSGLEDDARGWRWGGGGIGGHRAGGR